jgi:hypothetical protein
MLKKTNPISAAEELDIPGEMIHPPSHLSGQVNGRRDTFLDNHPPFPFNEVIRMGDDLLFGGTRHAVAGGEPEKGAFIGRKTCPGVTFDNPGDLFVDPMGTQVIGSLLRMLDRVGRPPADVMEHRTFGYLINPYKGIACSIPDCHVVHGAAMGDHLFIAACLPQQVLTGFIRPVWHDPGIF